MSDTYEKIKNTIEKELEQLTNSGILSNNEKVSLSKNLISYDQKQNYFDVSEPPTSNEKSHSLYGREHNYLNKKMLDSESNRVYIKTENNLYLKNKEDGEVELINKENIENDEDIIWTIVGDNTNFVRFSNKNNAYLRVYPNLRIKTPLLLTGEDDTETNSNLWKLQKKDNVYILENSFFKNHKLDNTLKVSEGDSDNKRWILEEVPIKLNINYPIIKDEYEKQKSEIIDTYIQLKYQKQENMILLDYLLLLKDKILDIYNKYENNNLEINNNNNLDTNNNNNLDTNNNSILNVYKDPNLIKEFIKDYENKINVLEFSIQNSNETINNKLEQLEEKKDIFINDLKIKLNTLKTKTYKNKHNNYALINNIKQQHNKTNKSSNNINFINNKSLIMDNNILVLNQNNIYLQKKKNIIFLFIIIFSIILMGISITILNDIYKLANNMD